VTAQSPPDAIEQAVIDALVAHRVDREGSDFDYTDPSLLGYARAVARVARTEADDSYNRGRADAAAQLVALADRLDADCAHWGVASAISPGLRNAADVLTGESWLLKPVGRAVGFGLDVEEAP
jgi:hypothetical protein